MTKNQGALPIKATKMGSWYDLQGVTTYCFYPGKLVSRLGAIYQAAWTAVTPLPADTHWDSTKPEKEPAKEPDNVLGPFWGLDMAKGTGDYTSKMTMYDGEIVSVEIRQGDEVIYTYPTDTSLEASCKRLGAWVCGRPEQLPCDSTGNCYERSRLFAYDIARLLSDRELSR